MQMWLLNFGLRIRRRVRLAGMLLSVLVLCLCVNLAPAGALESINYTLSDLKNSDFAHQDVSGTSLAGADMRNADFHDSNLSDTILTMANFQRANLSGADFSDAFCDRAIFNNANLTNALFVNTLLNGSIFTEADITGADFTDALLDRQQIATLCSTATGTNSTTGISTADSLGCN